MHELALAEAVVTAALETARSNGLTRITRIEVRVGELQQIENDAFELAIRELLPPGEPSVAGAVVEVRPDAAVFRCRACGAAFGLSETGGPQGDDASEAIHFIPELAHAFLRCPSCQSPDFEVTAGRGVRLEAIEGD
jgi:hydrogenase nickel incorporation protein HypA/HybF